MQCFFVFCVLVDQISLVGMAFWIWYSVSRAVIDRYSRCFAYVGILYDGECNVLSQELMDDLCQNQLRCVPAILDDL
ncbi:hypothetical protein B0T13DRAFT_476182 [Neurospora crassa]|nr:hypothetical protein B0T13DRAFT_476182 [Neurospora crassa]